MSGGEGLPQGACLAFPGENPAELSAPPAALGSPPCVLVCEGEGAASSAAVGVSREETALDAYRRTAGLQSAESLVESERQRVCPNYDPTPVVLTRGAGVFVWDLEGRRYFDFVSGVSSLNQGHGHPRILKALQTQAARLTLTCRVLYNDCLPAFAHFLTTLLGYDEVLVMNTGVEAAEAALKIARKFAYERKGIAANEAEVVLCRNNYWGRSITACSSSSTKVVYQNFGPFTPGFRLVPFGDIDALKEALNNPRVCAFMTEPVQGEGGVVVPPAGYLTQAAEACREAGCLFIADEIQTGLGRTGKMLACDWEGVKPDLLLLGKSLSGGVLPCSAVLVRCVCTREEASAGREAEGGVSLAPRRCERSAICARGVLTPGTHGSTFGGNPLAAAVCLEALSVLQDEKLARNADRQGLWFRKQLRKLTPEALRGRLAAAERRQREEERRIRKQKDRTPPHPEALPPQESLETSSADEEEGEEEVQHEGLEWILDVRGKGLLNAVEVDSAERAQRLTLELAKSGILCRATRGSVLRFIPPLTINRAQLREASRIVAKVFTRLEAESASA